MRARLYDGPWSSREGLLVLIAFALAYTACTAAHMAIVKHTVGMEAYLGDGPRLPPALLITSQWIKAVVLLGVLALLALHRKRLGWAALGFVRAAPRWYVWAVVFALGGFVLRLGLAKALVVALPDWLRHAASPYAWGDATWPQMMLLLGTTIVVTPLAEEAFFRGFLFRWMATKHPLWLAVVASSAMFGASHIVPAQAISAAVMSLLIILLYVCSRSIWPCIVCHALNNALGVGLGMAAVAGRLPAWLTPPH